ncbi:MAG: 3-hydroxyisobutyrate dehydrogenase [Betaproteobacteria bacterium RBG_16_64_18]|nr:MAG: 3-hydroxyisobutyrate dehydrogenase [Betaproteobacteria bacterium RBG_16_64_18]OGA12955.1 MAG: 3-hydroxyisobutyrate dehydrogenase [Betaproteobacteria bacterium RIFCSPLOWO2_02_FULL_65_20]OGA41955.1 MAG: 3-hydroxyisobutyrate dehydrogenase [Betaproteobacteria bacterium RIFCSPLOWO2_12_FULL_65_110]
MGAAIAGRLLGLGHEVTVWNRTADKARALASAGAKLAANPAELAAQSDFVVSILSNAEAIDRAYGGASGLLSANVAGKLFIEMSTVRPETGRALDQKVKQKGAALIECPVGGSVGPARDGKLFGFVGGAAADVARAKPLLDQLCRRVEHVGAVGAGAGMKLAINLPLLVFWQSFGEALSLCEPLGLDPARLVDIFADTSGGPNVLKGRGPMIVAALQGKDTGPITFDVDGIRKDLRNMIEEAAARGATLPVTSQALECFDDAARDGLGASDAVALPVRWMKRARAKN